MKLRLCLAVVALVLVFAMAVADSSNRCVAVMVRLWDIPTCNALLFELGKSWPLFGVTSSISGLEQFVHLALTASLSLACVPKLRTLLPPVLTKKLDLQVQALSVLQQQENTSAPNHPALAHPDAASDGSRGSGMS